MSLQQAISTAVRESRELLIAGLDTEAANAEMTIAEGEFDWLLNASGQYSSGPRVDDGADSINDLIAQLSLSRKLPWNGRIGLTAAVERFDRDFAGASGQARDWTALQLTFNQPLLRGFGTEVGRAAIVRATAERDVQQMRCRARMANVMRDTTLAYWGLAFGTRSIEIERAAVELSRRQLEITKKQVEIGRVTEADELAVQGVIALREEALVVAENDLLQKSVELRRTIGMPIRPGDTALIAADPPPAELASFDGETFIAKVKTQSPELAAAKLAVQKFRVEAAVASDATLPQLDLHLFAGPIGTTLQENGAPGGIAEAAEALIRFDDIGYGARLDFALPLENRAAEGALQGAQLRIRSAELIAEELERRLAQTAITLLNQVQTAARRIELTKTVTRFAQRTSDVEQALFEVGRTTSFVMLQRQDELREAQLRELSRVIDYLKAVAIMEALTGEILDRYQMSCEDISRALR